jgi:diacylglycerol O-acyltransferase
VHTLSGLDASFLYFETPSMHMHVVGTVVVDPTGVERWGPQRVAELLRERLELIPPFRQRLQQATLRLHHPMWVDVSQVDVDAHLSRALCPAPGTDTELATVVADFAGRQLDRSRPLWEVLVVDGLENGRSAVVIKVHHSAVDGVGAANVLGALFDLDPGGRTEQQVRELAELQEATRPVSAAPLDRVRRTATGIVTRPLGVVRLLPTAARSVARLVNARSNESTGSGGAVPFVAPRAPFNGRISPRRVVAFADVAVEDVKAVKSGLGGTFNDVLIALCGSAFRSYLQSRGDLPTSSLIAVCPVSVRADQTGGNAVSAMFTTLATSIADPVERYQAVRRANDVGKADHQAIGGDLLWQAAELAPPNMTSFVARAYSAVRLANLHPVVHNVVISNVPGPPVQLFFGGASIEALYPLGPVLEGPALNITVVSYRDRIGFGFIGCAHRIPDLADLAAAVPGALTELVAAAQG